MSINKNRNVFTSEAEEDILKIFYDERYDFSYGELFAILSNLMRVIAKNLIKDENGYNENSLFALEQPCVQSDPKLRSSEKNEVAKLINADEAKKSYADFMKIDEKILMLLSEDDNAFYFLHRKKGTWWKTSVSKNEHNLFRALDSLTEEEIELYDKWLSGSK